MKTSHLLTIVATGSVLVVGLVWQILEREQPTSNAPVLFTPVDNARTFSPETPRSTPITPYVAKAPEEDETGNAGNTSAPRVMPPPLVARPSYQPTAVAPVPRSTGSISPVSNSRTPAAPAEEQPSQAATVYESPAVETEFTPLYPPTPAGRAAAAPMILELDPGIRVPAAVLDDPEPLTPAEFKAKELVASEFANDLSDAMGQPELRKQQGAASDVSEADWAEARRKADERYRTVFGDAAYNRASMQSAMEALR